MGRNLPEVELTSCPPSYARVVAQGYDTVQEAFALIPTPAFTDRLEQAQAEARDLSADLDGTVEFDLFGSPYKLHATGAKGGFRFRLESDDLLILIGSPARDWTISVRYLSAGLWEHGLDALRERALTDLRPYCDVSREVYRRSMKGDDYIRTSRVDYCFDFYSPAFSAEFTPGLSQAAVCHSSAKCHEAFSAYTISRGGRGETLTIGSKAGLQVQVYDKTLEIDQASGKTWLHDVWIGACDGEWIFGDAERPQDVWRLECRFSGDFLKERALRRPAEVERAMPELLAEALFKRRLGVVDPRDSNRWRWPMHPLWSEAARRRAGHTMRPIGRKVTERRARLIERAEMAIAGNLRSAVVLEHGCFGEDFVFDLIERSRARIQADPDHARKVARAQSRYAREDEAR